LAKTPASRICLTINSTATTRSCMLAMRYDTTVDYNYLYLPVCYVLSRFRKKKLFADAMANGEKRWQDSFYRDLLRCHQYECFCYPCMHVLSVWCPYMGIETTNNMNKKCQVLSMSFPYHLCPCTLEVGILVLKYLMRIRNARL